MLETIENEAKTLMAQHKDQRGRFTTSQKEAELCFYRRMYHMFRRQCINIFSEVPESELARQNKELKAKLKSVEDSYMAALHNKKQLQAQCILLQDTVVKLRDQVSKLQNKRKI